MAIEYRNVDAEEIQQQVLTNRALEAERQAFAAEMEVSRLQTVSQVATKQEDRDAFIEAQRAAEADAAQARARATRLRGDRELPAEGVAKVRTDFLNTWITSLEQEHVAHAALINQREASLAMTGPDAPTEQEKEDITARLEKSREALAIIESSWTVATTSLDAVNPQPSSAQPVEDTPTNVTQTAVNRTDAGDLAPTPNNSALVE